MIMDVKFEELNATLTADVTPTEKTIESDFSSVVRVPTAADHRALTHRDAADAHPISAITNLPKELDKKVDDSDALTNAQIQKLLGW